MNNMSPERGRTVLLVVTTAAITLATIVVAAILFVRSIVSSVMACVGDPECFRIG